MCAAHVLQLMHPNYCAALYPVVGRVRQTGPSCGKQYIRKCVKSCKLAKLTKPTPNGPQTAVHCCTTSSKLPKQARVLDWATSAKLCHTLLQLLLTVVTISTVGTVLQIV
jgi:hypothetical protein